MIQLSPLKWIVSPFRDPTTTSIVNEGRDDTTWELRHYVKYVAKGNPSMLEAIYSPLEARTFCDPIIQVLIDNRTKLLNNSAILEAHRGYASSQVKRIACADRVIGGEQITTATVDKEQRRRKAAVAYIRTLYQGASLLRSGDFNTWLETGSELREWLFGVKTGAIELTEEEFGRHQATADQEIQEAFDNAPPREVDYDWLEDYLVESYLTGNKSHQ